MNLGSEQVPEEHSFFHFHTNNIVNINSNNKTMSEPQKTLPALSWEELEALAPPPAERTQGPSNAQATLRLFGQEESCVRVVLFRDHHGKLLFFFFYFFFFALVKKLCLCCSFS